MKLRRCFRRQQLLFLALGSALAMTAHAQDKITLKDGRTQDVKIVGVSASSVQVQVAAGVVGIPLANVAQVSMTPPPEFAAALAAYEAKDFPKALAAAKSVTEKFRGLPASWAQQAASLTGDIYVALNDMAKAEEAYNDFQKSYPGASSVQTDVGLARIAVRKNDFAGAKQKLEPLSAQALQEKNPAKNSALAYGQAFYLLGQIAEAEKEPAVALQNYLRTVAIFPEDRIAAASAQERADAIRGAQPVAVP
ncbi:MAG: hypothetical protein M3O82_10610 [Verrucomicrobiota bacterium]|nr:hypothetical protein [Verrucomicrobiota bacterium]